MRKLQSYPGQSKFIKNKYRGDIVTNKIFFKINVAYESNYLKNAQKAGK